jgi:hypothetical protein
MAYKALLGDFVIKNIYSSVFSIRFVHILFIAFLYAIASTLVYFVFYKFINFNLLIGLFIFSTISFVVLRYFIQLFRIPLFIIGDLIKNSRFEDKAYEVVKMVFFISTIINHFGLLIGAIIYSI